MPIIRAPRPQSNFYVLDKKISEDERLSWAARGMLIFLLGKPDYWRVNIEALINETSTSCAPLARDGVRRIIADLIKVGYIVRAQSRNEGEFGEVEYMVCEHSQPQTENPAAMDESSRTALPVTVEPSPVDPRLVSIEKAVRTEEVPSTEVELTLESPSSESKQPKPRKSKGSKRSLQEFFDDCKAKGVQTIADNDPINRWGNSVGVPQEFLSLAWSVFKDRYRNDPTKRYADWRAHFRNAVKRNWYHLWYFDTATEECRLTTAGEQARREFFEPVSAPAAPVMRQIFTEPAARQPLTDDQKEASRRAMEQMRKIMPKPQAPTTT